MLRALISIKSQPQLLDAPQALKLRRINQAHEQLAFRRIGAKTNDVMHGIAVNALAHNLVMPLAHKLKKKRVYHNLCEAKFLAYKSGLKS